MSIPHCTRRVNVERMRPVIDPFTRRGAGAHTDPDELPPACSGCGGERLWYVEPRTYRAELVCVECVGFVPADGAPEAEPPDLPPLVQMLRRAEQEVYRIVRDHRGLGQYEIWEEYQRRVDSYAGRSTVGHAVTRLREAGFIRKGEGGWVATEA